jgi:hypothetical protein
MLINVLHVLPVFRSVEQNLQETNCRNGRLVLFSFFRLRIISIILKHHKHVLFPEFVDIRMDNRERPMLVIFLPMMLLLRTRVRRTKPCNPRLISRLSLISEWTIENAQSWTQNTEFSFGFRCLRTVQMRMDLLECPE